MARARFIDISSAGRALAPKSAEVRAMAIAVAAVATSRGFVQILITLLMPWRRRAGTCSQVVAKAEGPPMPSPASVLPSRMLSFHGSGSSGDIG